MDGEREGSRSKRALLDNSRRERSRPHGRLRPRRAGRACTCEEAGCELAILKAKSPSCGSGEVYDGTFSGTLVPGWGIAAAAFRDAGIAVIDETADFNRLSRM